MNPFIKNLKEIYHIGEEIQLALEKELSHHLVEKDAFLVQEGHVCHRLYFIVEGCVRGYYNKEGKEVSHWFGFETDFVTSFQSFTSRLPGIENIQAIERTSLWSISHKSLYKLYDQYREIERLGRITCEQYYNRLEDRYVNAQFKSASDRYTELLESKAHIIRRVPLGYIASYLGISQETLSRIRSKPS
ncbi:MAG: Crp/Fnr family transcriptional regulator [Cyclobacteriaceae bacterium]